MEDSKYHRLWEKASTYLRRNQKNKENAPSKDVMGIMQELNTYRIELDMQNEELQKTQLELEESRNKYIELYDFAPVAYLMIGKDDTVLEANLTAIKLFGAKSHLKGSAFSKLITRDSQDVFYFHKRELFKTMKKQVCELELRKLDGTEFNALLQSVAVPERKGNSESIRVVITDTTDRIKR